MTYVLIGIAVLALLALVVVGTSFRRRDTYTAIGQLSGETVKRDRARQPVSVGADGAEIGQTATPTTGSAVEAAARAERSGELASTRRYTTSASSAPEALQTEHGYLRTKSSTYEPRTSWSNCPLYAPTGSWLRL